MVDCSPHVSSLQPWEVRAAQEPEKTFRTVS